MGFVDEYPREYMAFRTSLKETSYDSENREYMTESQIAVINFDKTKADYMRDLSSLEDIKSVDAIAKGTDDALYMIEFKNGHCKGSDVHVKIKDSVLILCDLCNQRLADARREIVFVLIVNLSKFRSQDKDALIRAKMAGRSSKFCRLDNTEGFLVKQVLVFDKKEMEAELIPMLTDM